jgi:hypothetical protein
VDEERIAHENGPSADHAAREMGSGLIGVASG